MPEDTSTGTSPARLLPVTMPAPAALSIGDWHGRGLCTDEDPDLSFRPTAPPAPRPRKSVPCALSGRSASNTQPEPTSSASGAASTSRRGGT